MGMLSMPREANEQMVECRREELFEMFWTELELDKDFVINRVRQRENDFIEEHSEFTEEEDGALPRWLLRMEAQDVLMGAIAKEFGVTDEPFQN